MPTSSITKIKTKRSNLFLRVAKVVVEEDGEGSVGGRCVGLVERNFDAHLWVAHSGVVGHVLRCDVDFVLACFVGVVGACVSSAAFFVHLDVVEGVALDAVHFKQTYVLLGQGIFGFANDAYQCILVQIRQRDNDRDSADQLGDQTEFYQIVRVDIAQQLTLGFLGGILQVAAKAQRGRIGTLENMLFQCSGLSHGAV